MNTTNEYKDIRIRQKKYGTGTSYFRVYEIQLKTYPATEKRTPTQQKNTSIDGFTQTEGSLYQWQYLEEEDRGTFNLTQNITESTLRVYCKSTVTNINITADPQGKNYTLGLKNIPRKIETLIEYEDGTDYYRRHKFNGCDNRYQNLTWYLIDATVDNVMFLTITIDDQTPTNKWEEGKIRLKRYTDTILETITTDEWQADNTAAFYLMPNREYSLTLTADDCSENNIGWITTESGVTSKTITITGIDYSTDKLVPLFENVTFKITYYNNTEELCLTFNDTGNEMDYVNWSVLNRTTGATLYTDYTTASHYHSCYTGVENGTYSVHVTFSHPDGSVHDFTLGTVKQLQKIFEEWEYSGEILGLTWETAFLITAMLLTIIIAFAFTARTAGIGALTVFGLTAAFTAVGWMAFYDESITGAEATTGAIIMVVLLLLAVFANYRQGVTT